MCALICIRNTDDDVQLSVLLQCFSPWTSDISVMRGFNYLHDFMTIQTFTCLCKSVIGGEDAQVGK